MELNVKYPQFTGRRYGVTIYHNNSKTLIPPESFFIGNFLATPRAIIRERLREWVEFEKQERDFGKLFDVSKRYGIKVREDGGIKKRRRGLTDLSLTEMEFALSQKIKSKEGSYSLLKTGGDKAFNINLKEGKGIHAGNIVLVGYVKSKSDGRISTKFKRVSITGPFKQSKLKFADVRCICEDSGYSEDKEGYENVNLLCTHTGALLYFAHQNPDKIRRFRHIRDLMGEDTEIFMPFHSDHPQEKPDIKVEGQHLTLDYLVLDVILSRFFNDENLFDIGKKLTRIPIIYDDSLENLILDERAGFEVLVNKYIFDTAKGINPAVRTLFNMMRKYLEDQDYKMAGYCLEKRDSPYETVALIFRKNKDEVRLLFNKNFPPVAVVRKDRPSVVQVHRYIDENTQIHPFNELFMPKTILDDRTRKDTHYEMIIPNIFRVPKALFPDYKSAIVEHFPGGVDNFREQVYRRGNIKNKSNLLAIVN